MTRVGSVDRSNPWQAHSVRIQEIQAEAVGVATWRLAFDDARVAARYRFQPGQFNMLYLPGVGEAAISISGDPAVAAPVPHTIRLAGNVTQALSRLPVGASLGLRGPFGSSWPMETARGRDVILVAGGIGLAPLRPVIYQLLAERQHFGRIWLLYGARHPSGLLYTDEQQTWNAQGIEVLTTVDRGDSNWRGSVGVVTMLMEQLPLSRPADTLLMTCGPEVMMWYVVQSALERGLREQLLYVSLERNMNCAIGLCGHCQFGPEFVCKDGPVFRYDRVASILKVHDL